MAVRDGGDQGPVFAKGLEEGHAGPCDQNRQASRYSQRLRGFAEALGGREDLPLAGALPHAGQEL